VVAAAAGAGACVLSEMRDECLDGSRRSWLVWSGLVWVRVCGGHGIWGVAVAIAAGLSDDPAGSDWRDHAVIRDGNGGVPGFSGRRSLFFCDGWVRHRMCLWSCRRR
jgi:hypothetical protein